MLPLCEKFIFPPIPLVDLIPNSVLTMVAAKAGPIISFANPTVQQAGAFLSYGPQ